METINDLTNFIKSNNHLSLIDIRSLLIKTLGTGYKVNKLERADDPNTGRICISFSSTVASKNELQTYCNGIIYDYPSCNILCIPNKRIVGYQFTQSIPDTAVFYDIVGGSMINLYWYGGWRLSTINGIDMGGVSWIGNKTYGGLLFCVAEKIGIKNIYGDKRLDKNYTYTCILCAQDYQLISQKPDCLYFISARNCAAINNGYPITSEPIPAGLPTQLPRDLKPRNANVNRNEFIKRQLKFAHKTFMQTGVANLGYMVKIGDNFYSMESDLSRMIKRMTNDMPPRKEVKLDYSNRLLFITLRAFLNPVYKNLFLKLQPQAINMYIQFSGFINNLLTKVLSIIMQNSVPPIEYGETLTIDQIAIGIANNMISCGVTTNKSVDVIKDCLQAPDKLGIYFAYLSTKQVN